MNGLTFASPDWFWGLILILPLLVLRFWSHWRSADQLPGLVSPRLSRRLISGSSRAQRWVVFSLQCVALAATLVALARPQLGFIETDTETDARNLIIAIDTSRSMLADDLPPNRLTRAKLAAKDIVLSLPEDRIGLIAFAGKPFVQAPLTVDHEAVLESLDQLDTEIIPRGGTNLAAAAALALETFEEAKLEQSALIVFSDGESLEGASEIEGIRERAARQGMTIHSVGVGTPEGSIIPEMDDNGVPIPGVFVKDDAGQVVRTRLVPEALQSISANGGFYIHLGGSSSLTRVVEQ
ncbi:MAG: VWA domain-containing protein, partial [Verrucomicrobiales bacterium]